MAIHSSALRKLMDEFLEEVVDIDDREDFHFSFCSLLTYVVDKEMERDMDVMTMQKKVDAMQSQLNKLKAEKHQITEFKKG